MKERSRSAAAASVLLFSSSLLRLLGPFRAENGGAAPALALRTRLRAPRVAMATGPVVGGAARRGGGAGCRGRFEPPNGRSAGGGGAAAPEVLLHLLPVVRRPWQRGATPHRRRRRRRPPEADPAVERARHLAVSRRGRRGRRAALGARRGAAEGSSALCPARASR